MTDPLPIAHPLRVTSLSSRKPTRFDLAPDASQREAIALLLGILSLHDLHFRGEVRAAGRHDFVLEARLTGRAVQPCVVTLAPVTTPIDETVIRKYLSDYAETSADEAEMPPDETAEPLGDVIDPAAVMVEAVALALPDYPRAVPAGDDGDTLAVAVAPPGAVPLTDADLKPFAGLEALRRKLAGDESDGDGGPDGTA